MKSFSFVLVLSLAIIAVLSDQQCKTICWMSYPSSEHQCVVCFDQCGSQRQFENCRNTGGDLIEGQSLCVEYCCGVIQQSFTDSIYSGCISSQKIETPALRFEDIQTYVIIASLVVPGLLIAVICYCICRKGKKVETEEQESPTKEPNESKYKSYDEISEEGITIEKKIPFENQDVCLSKQSVMGHFQHKQICSLCSMENINCLTTCNHAFHFKCLQKWVKDNQLSQNCPYGETQRDQQVQISNDSQASNSSSSEGGSPKDNKYLKNSQIFVQQDKHLPGQINVFCQKCKNYLTTIDLSFLRQKKDNPFNSCTFCCNK